MKCILVFFSLICLNSQSFDLNTIRTAYKQAAQDKTKVTHFYNLVSEVTKNEKLVLVTYKGAAIALQARKAKTIKAKKTGFIEGITLVEYSIEKAPNNIELRFIRFTIQENTPKLLKYKGNLEEDKNFIINQLKHTKSTHLKNYIKDYISQSKGFTAEEKAVILGS